MSSQETLTKKAWQGLTFRQKDKDQKYRDRLTYELEVICKLGFDPYFLVLEDIVRWAKKNNITYGWGRGSAAGSLLCYCLEITKVDPLKHNLLFERFLNPSRVGKLKIETSEISLKKFIEEILPTVDGDFS